MRAFGFANAGAVRPVALGVVATALALGCGSGSGAPSGTSTKEQAGSAKAAITSRSLTVKGCQVHGVFDITSPQAIDFVAMDGSDLTHAQMLLYTVDARNEQSQVQKTPQHASPSMQALLGGASAPAAPVKVLTLQSSAFQMAGSSTNGSSSSTHTSTSTSTAMMLQQTTSTSGSTDQTMGAHGAGASGTSNASSGSSSSSAAMLVFDDLSQLGSSHMVLVVDATAKQLLGMLRLFQGTNGAVTAVQSFPVMTTMCSSVSASVPLIAPVAIPGRSPWSPGGTGGD